MVPWIMVPWIRVPWIMVPWIMVPWIMVLCMRLTGEGELRQWDVTVQTVVDEADADALGLHLHPRQRSRVAAGAGLCPGPGPGVGRHVLSVLLQPRGGLVQLAWGSTGSVFI